MGGQKRIIIANVDATTGLPIQFQTLSYRRPFLEKKKKKEWGMVVPSCILPDGREAEAGESGAQSHKLVGRRIITPGS